MSSGNFIVGYGLSLEGFNRYVKPNIEKQGLVLTDSSTFKYGKNKIPRILVSVYSKDGMNSLEQRMKEGLDKAFADIGEDIKKINNLGDMLALGSQIKEICTKENKYSLRTMGIYPDKEAASKLFPGLVDTFC